jgi:hypothetical protein
VILYLDTSAVVKLFFQALRVSALEAVDVVGAQ